MKTLLTAMLVAIVTSSEAFGANAVMKTSERKDTYDDIYSTTDYHAELEPNNDTSTANGPIRTNGIGVYVKGNIQLGSPDVSFLVSLALLKCGRILRKVTTQRLTGSCPSLLLLENHQ